MCYSACSSYTLVKKSKIATFQYNDGLKHGGVFGVKVHLACNWLLSSYCICTNWGKMLSNIAQQTYKRDWMFCPSVIWKMFSILKHVWYCPVMMLK